MLCASNYCVSCFSPFQMRAINYGYFTSGLQLYIGLIVEREGRKLVFLVHKPLDHGQCHPGLMKRTTHYPKSPAGFRIVSLGEGACDLCLKGRVWWIIINCGRSNLHVHQIISFFFLVTFQCHLLVH